MMAGFPRLTLATRIMLGAAVFLVLAASTSVYLIVDASRRIYLADLGAASAIRAEQNAQQIVEQINTLRRDVLFLSNAPPIQGILRAARNQGMDTQEGNSIETWAKRLQEIFSAFAEARPDYYQLR